MKKIVFIGFCGKGFGDFLNSLNEQLQFFDICLEVIAFGAHEEFLSDKDCNFPFFDLQYLPSWNEPLGKAELWINLFPADLYIIWSGYHGIYANLRKYLHDLQIPYLLSEYTSVENLFFFDNGLHAEATIPLKKSIDNFQISFLESYIKPRYSKNNQDQEIEKEFLKSKNKKILFVGMWDDASGIKEPNLEKIQRKLSPYFKSSYEAANLIVNQLPENCILILKSHPHDSVEEKEKLKNLSNDETIFYIDSDVSIEELITISDLVITIASTVSILTAYLEKPLLLLGNTYLSSSNYSIKYDDKLSLKAQLISILEDFSLDGKARDSFFSSYLLDYETYSSDEVLNSFGVKSHNDLAIKCKMMIDKTYKFNFILNKEYFETISNLIKFSVEKHSLFLWQYERINEFLEKKKIQKINYHLINRRQRRKK